MFQNYIKVTVRSLLRKKLFSFINIIGLALGIVCCMLISLYIADEYSFDRFHQNGDRIFRIIASVDEKGGASRRVGASNAIMGPGLKAEIPEIEGFVRMASNHFLVKVNVRTFDQEALFVDDNFLSVFSFPLIGGDVKTALKPTRAVVLTEETATRYFGSPNVVGRTLELEMQGKFEQFVVTAVTGNIPGNSSINFGMLLPISLNRDIAEDRKWLGFSINTFLVLNRNSDYELVESKINRSFARNVRDEMAFAKENAKVDLDIKLALQPIRKIHLNADYIDNSNGVENGSTPVYSSILAGLGLFILLIACINFISLSIAGSLKRNKEIGIRKVIGGQRVQIIIQFLGESLACCLLAFMVAGIIVVMSLGKFNELSGKEFNLLSFIDLRFLAVLLMLFLVTGMLAGGYPAWVLSGYNPVANIAGRKNPGYKHYFGKMLISIQFMFATFLIAGTVVAFNQYHFLTQKSLGYDDSDLLEIDLGTKADTRLVGLFKNELWKNPAVKSVTGQFYRNTERMKVNGREIDCESMLVDENYLETLRIPLTGGRNFSVNFPADVRESVIVNETFAKQAGIVNVGAGQKMDYVWTTEKAKIIGIASDYHFESIKEKIKPLMLKVYPENRTYKGKLLVKLTPENKAATIRSLAKIHRNLIPYNPFTFSYVKHTNSRNYLNEQNWKQIITLAASIAVLIACIGLLGLTVLSTESRSREVGIRKVLGSSIPEIVWLFTSDFLKLVLAGVILALPAAWFASEYWLENFAYRANIGWWFFAGCGVTMAVLAAIPVMLQSFKASLKNPVTVL
ncbi:ABC transporter permease [Dyadobacter bucti]|uniref:ABC transporter permease n=1 Tax=Dyadobacter bucti TaxID=2572203 RepID=UPI003F72F34C